MNPQSGESTLSEPTPDERFLERIGRVLDAGAVSIMLSVGHRLRLFDTLSALPPSTSAQVAEAAALSERYVREWLAAMVVAEIVVYEPSSRTYRLPEEHSACLTQGAPLGNLAVYAQLVAMTGAMQERILECFETGDGLGYDDYPCFHRIMSEDSGQTVVANIDDLLHQLVPDTLVRLEQGIDVLDAGCGAGLAMAALADKFPKSRFTGYDLCPEAIRLAREHASRQGVENVDFQVVDLARWECTGAFDLVTSFDAVHDTKDPQGLIASIHGALRPGGTYLMQDIGGSANLENNIDFPFAALLYTISTFHCTPVSLAQNGKGLGTMWGWETADRMLREAGFDSIARNVLAHDPMNVWFVSGKSAQPMALRSVH